VDSLDAGDELHVGGATEAMDNFVVVDDEVLVMTFEDQLPNVLVDEDVSKIEVRKVKLIVWFWIDRKTLLAAIKVTRLILSFQWGVSLVYDRKMANLVVRLARAPQQSHEDILRQQNGKISLLSA
jgi:hypothetical protein